MAEPPDASRGSILLGEVASRTAWLDVACNQCPRRGRLSTASLLRQHGAHLGMPLLRRLVSADCPQWRSSTITTLCGVHFPQLARLFLPGE